MLGKAPTVVEVDRLFQHAGLSGGDPQGHPGVFQAEPEQFLGPVSHLVDDRSQQATRESGVSPRCPPRCSVETVNP